MEAFVKDRKTFVTKSHNLVLDYNIHYSIYDTVSSIVIETPEILPQEGDILYLDGNGFFGVIKTISPDKGKTTLDCNQIITLFARDIYYQAGTWTYLEDYLTTLINANYTNCPDSYYALPYLQVTAATHTASQMGPDLDDDNVYNIKSYANKMRRLYNIFCEWGITRDTLSLDITYRSKQVKNIDFGNPNYVLLTQDFSEKSVSKITSFCTENSQQQDWVLLEDGSITNTAPATGRVPGEWITLTVQNAADVESSVRDTFAKNEYSHNITFQAPVSTGLRLYDRLKIKLDNQIFSSYVSGVIARAHSAVIEITCGELQMQYPYYNLL